MVILPRLPGLVALGLTLISISLGFPGHSYSKRDTRPTAALLDSRSGIQARDYSQGLNHAIEQGESLKRLLKAEPGMGESSDFEATGIKAQSELHNYEQLEEQGWVKTKPSEDATYLFDQISGRFGLDSTVSGRTIHIQEEQGSPRRVYDGIYNVAKGYILDIDPAYINRDCEEDLAPDLSQWPDVTFLNLKELCDDTCGVKMEDTRWIFRSFITDDKTLRLIREILTGSEDLDMDESDDEKDSTDPESRFWHQFADTLDGNEGRGVYKIEEHKDEFAGLLGTPVGRTTAELLIQHKEGAYFGVKEFSEIILFVQNNMPNDNDYDPEGKIRPGLAMRVDI